MTPLERGQLSVMRVNAAIGGLVLLAVGAAVEAVLGVAEVLPPGLVLAPLLVLTAYTAFVAPPRRYRAWGYALADDELRIAYGIWTQIETHVPLARVQHIDVSQGPIERRYGVCRLILHTAGSANSRVVLPGLSRAAAEAIRDDVRARIRQHEE